MRIGSSFLKRRRKKLYLWVLSILVVWVLQYVRTGYLAVYPGPLIDLSKVVEVEGYSPRKSSFYMVSVVAKEANVYTFLRAIFDPKIGLWSKKSVLGSKTSEEYTKQSKELMEKSHKIATYIALTRQGLKTSPDGPFPVKVNIETGEVGGPSAGLVFALEILSRMHSDLVMERKIAGTGVLAPDGKVLPVGGVIQKAISCRREGVEILVVPRANAEEARRYAGEMKVIGVGSFDEAVFLLSRKGDP